MAEISKLRRKVLIVEDNQDYAELVSMVLQELPFEVEVAYSGRDALRIAREFHPEIVFCDLLLDPEMDGCSVARAFRSDPTLCGVRLVAFTGLDSEASQANAKQAGFDFFLPKTGDINALLRVIETVAT